MYDLSAPGDGGPYSHWARARGRKNTLTLPFLNASIVSKGALTTEFRPTHDGGVGVLEGLSLGGGLSYLSEGLHGRAYLTKQATPTFHKRLFQSLDGYVIGGFEGVPRQVIIKVHALDDPGSIDDARRECKLQTWVHDQTIRFGEVMLHGSDVTPRVFYGGLLQSPSGTVFITVMDIAKGKSVSDFIDQKGSLTARQFAHIEKAISTLWLLGVSHADLHLGNLFFDPKSCRVNIIDFGYAHMLTSAMTKKIRKFDFGRSNANRLYNDPRTGLAKYSNSIEVGRGYAWYNPEGKVARYLRGLVKDPQKLEAARHEVWR